MKKKVFEKLSIAQILVLAFAGLVLVGGTLLALPFSSRSGEWTPWIDAYFTATSALCVTGQVTLNTAEHWSLWGKLVIITLIEIGGLGIMGALSLFFFGTGRSISLYQQKIVKESLSLEDMNEAQSILKYVVGFSLGAQAIGAALLSIDFIPRLGVVRGLGYAVFHSISAFCNAGFDLFGDSLISFQNNSLVLLVIAALIAFSGLGFIVWRDLLTYRHNKKLLLHTKLVLITTGIVLGVSYLLLLWTELGHGTFAHLSLPKQWLNIFFTAVTPRTAGFSNLDYSQMSAAGLHLTNLLMFIGGSSGSTAGGFKVTTLAVLALFFVNGIRGREPHFMYRSIGEERIRKALFLLLVSLLLIAGGTYLLLATQSLPPEFGLEALLMEVFSCFGTVGLSMGLTPYFNTFGKVLLMVLMFMGRVGAMTVIWSFKKEDRESRIHYPEGNIMIG